MHVFSLAIYAQSENDYLKIARDVLKTEKKTARAEVMALRKQEAEVFWPLYNEYKTKDYLIQSKRLKKQESTVEKVETGTILRIQKSLIRMGYDRGDINGQMQSATQNAIKLYEQRHNLLEPGGTSQELLKQLLPNGGLL